MIVDHKLKNKAAQRKDVFAAKVAEYGWNKRRKITEQRETTARTVGHNRVFPSEPGWRDQPGFRGEREFRKVHREELSNQENRSFAEVARKDNHESTKFRVERTDHVPVMSWFGSRADEEWLLRSAVGELIEFKNVELVNSKLETRGFTFSSTYLGGKSIIWTFESECDRDGFIKNAFFWRDCFSSVDCWKYSKPGATRMFWIEAYDVPADCWCNEFFKKLGGQMGEMVGMDEDTATRSRLDKARILIVAPLDYKMVSEVTVKGGHREFTVRLKEDPGQVSIDWVNQFLGLHPSSKMEVFSSSRVVESSIEKAEKCRAQEGNRSEKQVVPDRTRDKVRFELPGQQNIKSVSVGADLKKVRPKSVPTTTLTHGQGKGVGGARSGAEKGKGRKIYSVNSKSLWLPMCNSGVKIGGIKKGRIVQSSETESSSVGPAIEFCKGQNYFVGEQSKVPEHHTLSPVNSSTEIEDNRIRPKVISKAKKMGGSYLVEKDNSLMTDPAQPMEQTQQSDYLGICESYVEETHLTSQGKVAGQGISLCIDLRSNGSDKSGSLETRRGSEGTGASNTASDKGTGVRKRGGREKRKKGRGTLSSVKSLIMKNRRLTGSKKRIKEVIWNLEEEITKVYEKGAELGVIFNSINLKKGSEEGEGD
ncbi:hypothetical protein Q3G72_027004 [Acer saccharum]|nr:hypothetical protein Q3G72_027004 [Acer saccharum]